MRTIYGIQNDNSVVFLDLLAAEKYLFNHYAEYISTKEQFIEYSENLIWEDVVR